MTYEVRTFVGEMPVDSEKIVIKNRLVYEVLNRYIKEVKKENNKQKIG